MKVKTKKLGITLNDYFLACLSSTFYDYSKLHGAEVPKDIAVTFPISMRNGVPNGPDEVKIENVFMNTSAHIPIH